MHGWLQTCYLMHCGLPDMRYSRGTAVDHEGNAAAQGFFDLQQLATVCV